jgi:hypothetical protein
MRSVQPGDLRDVSVKLRLSINASDGQHILHKKAFIPMNAKL